MRALELGINFIDTAESYGTQSAIGRAIKSVPRDQMIISTKKGVGRPDQFCSPQQFREGVEKCLREFGTDFIDVFHAHGIRPECYDYVVAEIVPVLQSLQQAGTIRFMGITEMFNADPSHRMLARAVADGCWDVIMVGFNMLNPSANRTILPAAEKADVGALIMFAVRNALSQPQRLAEVLDHLIAEGRVDAGALDADDPLGFVLAGSDAASLVEAAYRYCRHQQGVHVVLTGTGSAEHLAANVQAILKSRLPDGVLQRLADIFGRVDCVSGS